MFVILSELIIIFLLSFIGDKFIKSYFCICALLLATYSIFFQPPFDFDLYRHYETLDNLRIFGWNFTTVFRDFKSLPIYAIYFYIMSRFSMNEMLPFVSTFITYYLIFRLIYLIYMRNNISRKYLVIVFGFVLFCTDYLNVISGIRNTLAFSIFSYTFYYDMVEKKYRLGCFITYLLLCLFHTSIFLLLIARFGVYLYKKNNKIIIIVLCIFWTFFLDEILKFLSIFKGKYFSLLQYKIETYFNMDRLNNNVLMFNLLVLILFILIIFRYNKWYKDNENIQREYIDVLKIIAVFSMGCMRQYDLFIRMVAFLISSSPYCLLTFLNEKIASVNYKIYKIFIYIILLVVIIIGIILQYSRIKNLSFNFKFY